MNSTLRRTLALGASAAMIMAGTAVLGATGAQAATGLVLPATGSAGTAFNLTTPSGCPAGTTNVNATMSGPGWTDLGIVSNTDVGVSTTAAFSVPLGDSLTGIAQSNGTTISTGKYDVTLSCTDLFGTTVFGTFTGSIWFTTTTSFQNTDPAAVISTGVVVTAPGTASFGSSVALVANVTPSAAPGSVQFFDGATPLGSPVTVSAGSATLNTTALPSGSRSITAQFTPTNGPVFPASGWTKQYSGSTSAATSVSITAGVSTATLSAPAAGGQSYDNGPVTLTCAVSPAVAGTVEFFNGLASLGTVANAAGSSSASKTLGDGTPGSVAQGSYTLACLFTPTNTNFDASPKSGDVAFSVVANPGVSTQQTITTTVVAGALTISSDASVVTLSQAVLNTAGDLFVSSGELNPITITDTRAGNPGWSATGVVSDFATADGSKKINGENLGWTPKLVSKAAAQTITLGSTVAPGNGVAVGATTGAGLKPGNKALASTALGQGNGTAKVSADLLLNIPTSTTAGTYSATLTVTAV